MQETLSVYEWLLQQHHVRLGDFTKFTRSLGPHLTGGSATGSLKIHEPQLYHDLDLLLVLFDRTSPILYLRKHRTAPLAPSLRIFFRWDQYEYLPSSLLTTEHRPILPAALCFHSLAHQ